MDALEIRITPDAAAWLRERGVRELTLESFVVAGCCVPDLPPVVHPGPPRHPEGFRCHDAGAWRVYVDPLLDPPPRLTIALRPLLQGGAELVVSDWPSGSGGAEAQEVERRGHQG